MSDAKEIAEKIVRDWLRVERVVPVTLLVDMITEALQSRRAVPEDTEIRELARELVYRKTFNSSKDEMDHWESGFFWGYKHASRIGTK